jgi:hypothetical protein
VGVEVEVGRGGMLEIAVFGVILTHDEDGVNEYDSGWPRWSRVYLPAIASVNKPRLSFVRSAHWPALCGRCGLHFPLVRYFFVVLSSSFTSKRSLYHVSYVQSHDHPGR